MRVMFTVGGAFPRQGVLTTVDEALCRHGLELGRKALAVCQFFAACT